MIFLPALMLKTIRVLTIDCLQSDSPAGFVAHITFPVERKQNHSQQPPERKEDRRGVTCDDIPSFFLSLVEGKKTHTLNGYRIFFSSIRLVIDFSVLSKVKVNLRI